MRLAPILIVLNVVETSMFPWRRSWFFCKFGTHTRWENHKWYVSIGRRWWFPLVRLFYTFLMFSGSPPLGYDVLLCFCCLAQSCASVLSAGSLLGSFRAGFSVCFSFQYRFFRTADPQSHTFVPAGATRPPTRQQIGSPSRFFSPSVVGFRTTFWYFFVFFGIMRFYVN